MTLIIVFNIAVLLTTQLSLSAARRLLAHPKDCDRLAHNHDPVCGSDGNTYENDSVIRRINCREKRSCADEITVVYEGPCDADDTNRYARSRSNKFKKLYRKEPAARPRPDDTASERSNIYLAYLNPQLDNLLLENRLPNFKKLYEDSFRNIIEDFWRGVRNSKVAPAKKINLFWISGHPSLVQKGPDNISKKLYRQLGITRLSEPTPSKQRVIKPLNLFWKNLSRFPSLVFVEPNNTLKNNNSNAAGISRSTNSLRSSHAALPGDCDWVTDFYSPVCGSDGNTYQNPSELRKHNCEQRSTCDNEISIAYDGECERDSDSIERK